MPETRPIASRRGATSGSRARPWALAALVAAALLGACGDADDAPETPTTASAPPMPPGAWSPVRGGVLEDEIERMRAEGLDWKQVAEEIGRASCRERVSKQV